MKTVNVVIVGTGFGEIAHIPAFNNCRFANLVGIYSRNKDKTKSISKKYKNIKIYNSINQILKDQEVDLVSLALPPFLNFEIIKKLIKSKKKYIM